MSSPLPVPGGTPHSRRNVQGGCVVVVVLLEVVVELVVVVPKLVVVVPKMVVVVLVVVVLVVVAVELVVVVVVLVVVELLVLVVPVVVVVLLVGVVVEVVLVVVEVVVDVVVEVVVVVSGIPSHGGSVGSVQEQSGFVMHSSTTDFLHWLRALPDKPAHAVLISSAQVLFVHFPATFASETKTPAASATAANATTALRVIVEPPIWPVPNRAVSRSLALRATGREAPSSRARRS